jgi:hypothetical protein
MKHLLRLLAVALFALVGSSCLMAQNSALVGTWKLNVAKSKYEPGPAPKSLTRTVEADGDGVKYTFDGVTADGKKLTWGFSTKFDGKDYPITGANPTGADAISAKRVDANHYVATLKKDGKEIGVSKVAISADGKTTTVDATGTNAAGAKTHDVQVYDRQ